MTSNAPPPTDPRDPPLHLTAADFDAYLPERAGSNAFNRPRLELKQRMLAWARGVVARLVELGIDVEASGSEDHPSVRNGRRVDCQQVFFWRDAESRTRLERLIDRKRSLAARIGDPAPHKSHVYLALRIDSARVEVSIELYAEAWVDVQNLRARLADPGRALELTAAFEALPEQFAIELRGVAAGVPAEAQRATNDDLRALLDRAGSEKAPLWIGWSVPRDVVLANADVLDEQLGDALVALGPLFKLVAWAPDNDLVVLDREWEAARGERAHGEAERDRAAWEVRRDDERRERATAKAKGKTKTRPRSEEKRAWRGERKRPGEREPEAPKDEPSKAEASPPPLASRARPIRPLARRAPRVTDVDPSAPVEKGARVHVLGGPFEGKVGVVQELDGKGGARVMLGLLAIRLEVKDLIVSVGGRDRPVLSSSHRRPLPARS